MTDSTGASYWKQFRDDVTDFGDKRVRAVGYIDGKYTDTVKLPAGSLPCDTAFEDGYTVVGCLEGPDKNAKGAPIYILKDDKIVSTILPQAELGLTQFTHVHNATARKIGNKLYVIAQAWNPGDFAIFEQVL